MPATIGLAHIRHQVISVIVASPPTVARAAASAAHSDHLRDSLPPPQSPATSLALERLPSPGPGSVACPTRPARVERSRPVAARGPVLGGVDREPPAVELAVVEESDRRSHLGLAGELDERKAPRAPGLAIRGQVDLHHAARLGQELRQGVGRGPGRQVSDEDSGRNG